MSYVDRHTHKTFAKNLLFRSKGLKRAKIAKIRFTKSLLLIIKGKLKIDVSISYIEAQLTINYYNFIKYFSIYFSVFFFFLGYTLCPLIMGALIDSACSVWQETCGETGNCWFYNIDRFSNLIHGISAFFCFLAALCIMVLYYFSNKIEDPYEDEDREYMLTNFDGTASEASDF